MSSVNKCIIVGNLGKDPEVRSFQNGGKVCNFSVATSERWKDKNTGEQKEKTEWHNVSIMNDALVGVAEKYLRKGFKVYLEGKLQTRKWQDQSGNDRYSTEVVLQGFDGKLVLLDKPEGEREPARGNGGSGGMARQQSAFVADLDDDVPFAHCEPTDNARRRIF